MNCFRPLNRVDRNCLVRLLSRAIHNGQLRIEVESGGIIEGVGSDCWSVESIADIVSIGVEPSDIDALYEGVYADMEIASET